MLIVGRLIATHWPTEKLICDAPAIVRCDAPAVKLVVRCDAVVVRCDGCNKVLMSSSLSLSSIGVGEGVITPQSYSAICERYTGGQHSYCNCLNVTNERQGYCVNLSVNELNKVIFL